MQIISTFYCFWFSGHFIPMVVGRRNVACVHHHIIHRIDDIYLYTLTTQKKGCTCMQIRSNEYLTYLTLQYNNNNYDNNK